MFPQVIRTVKEMRSVRNPLYVQDKKVGFVPTMGALHEGHASLIRAARQGNDKVVASIFVNPAQFAPHEDFGKYPRTFEHDLKVLKEAGADYVFAPDRSEMYPGSKADETGTAVGKVFVVPTRQDFLSEGKSRPGFYRGVCTVVSKLFNVVQPTRAYFGQKDGLQCITIRQMVRELNFPVQVVICPTSREADGLARSSRNVYLSQKQREASPQIYKALLHVQSKADTIRDADVLRKIGREELEKEKMWKVDYFSICDGNNGEEIEGGKEIPKGQFAMISTAVNLGNVRLLDNVLIGNQDD